MPKDYDSIPAYKNCKRCSKTKKKSSFRWRMRGKCVQLRHWCKKCEAEHVKETRRSTPTRTKEKQQKISLRLDHGLSLEQYQLILASQGGVCAICKCAPSRRRLGVDHCHITNEIRGLLCDSCNTGLGFMRDSKEILQSAALYVEYSRVGIKSVSRRGIGRRIQKRPDRITDRAAAAAGHGGAS